MGVAGRPLSAEHRGKISEANKGRKIAREIVERLAAERRGKKLKLSEEQRQAIRDRQTGRRMSEETKAKISAANKGRKLTAEDRCRRSLVAIAQGRGQKLNARVAADPVLAAKRQEHARKIVERIAEARRDGRPSDPTKRIRKQAAALARQGIPVVGARGSFVGVTPLYGVDRVVVFRP